MDIKSDDSVSLNYVANGQALHVTGDVNVDGNGVLMYARNTKVDGNLNMTNGGGFLEVGNVQVGKDMNLKTVAKSENEQGFKHFIHVVGDNTVGGNATIESVNNIHIGNYNIDEGVLLDGSLKVGGDLVAHAIDGHIMVTIDTSADKISLKSDNLNVLTDGKALLTANEYDFSSTGDVYVIPLEPWKLNTRYTWSVSQLRSKNNALINKSYSEDFVYRENTEFPVLEQMYGSSDSGMLRDREPITLLFSKSMDTSSLEKSIFVTPSMPGVLRSTEIPGEYKWFPSRNWQQETEYRFFVSNSAKDCDGLSLQKSYEKFFSVFNSYLTVDYIHFLYNEKPINLKQDSLKNLSAKLDTDSEYNSLPISVVFSSPIPEENRIVAVEGIGLSCIFPITGARPILYKVDWDESGKIVTLYWNNITGSSQDVIYYYELKITGGEKAVTNVLGDYFKEDVCVTFACQ